MFPWIAELIVTIMALAWGCSKDRLATAPAGECTNALLFLLGLLFGGMVHVAATSHGLEGLGLESRSALFVAVISAFLWVVMDTKIVRMSREQKAAKEFWHMAAGPKPAWAGPVKISRYATAAVLMTTVSVGATLQFMAPSIDQRRVEKQSAIDAPFIATAMADYSKLLGSADSREQLAREELAAFDARRADDFNAYRENMAHKEADLRQIAADISGLVLRQDQLRQEIDGEERLALCEATGAKGEKCLDGTGNNGKGPQFQLAEQAARQKRAELDEIRHRLQRAESDRAAMTMPVPPETGDTRRNELVAVFDGASAAKADAVRGQKEFIASELVRDPSRTVLKDNLATRINILGELLTESSALLAFAALVSLSIMLIELTALFVGEAGRVGVLELTAEAERRAVLNGLAKAALAGTAEVVGERNNVVLMDKLRRETDADNYKLFERGGNPPAAE